MSFVNEKISEVDKARIDWKTFDIQHPSFWTIDRDRDVFLVRHTLGRPEELDPKYLLSWRGNVIPVFTKGFWERKPGECEITGVGIPNKLESQRSEILNVLKQAFIAHGHNYDGVGINTVSIKNHSA